MVNKPKAIGTAAETAVVRYLRTHGFGVAERSALSGRFDRGDITGTPGVCWEVKSGQAAKTAGDGQVRDWMVETEVERGNCNADVGVLVMSRSGYGPDRCGNWWAVLPVWQVCHLLEVNLPADARPLAPVRIHLETAVRLLRSRGFGDPMLFTETGVPA